MRITLRIKLFAIVAVAAIALIVMTTTSGLSERTVERQVASIRDTYLPKLRLRPELAGGFERLTRTIQNAVEAADADLLTPAAGQRDAVTSLVADGRDGMTDGQAAALRLAVDDYYTSAIAVSRRLIAGDGGEQVTTQVQEMQTKRARVVSLIEQSTAVDEHALASAFAATEREQDSALIVRVVTAAVCLVLLLAISIWIGKSLFANLGALVAGFERFGRKDFATAIVPTSADELAEVALRANTMAEQLQRLEGARGRDAWLRDGLAGLGDELRGELEPADVADRAVAFLARYLQTPVGALYAAEPDGRYALLGRYALPDGAAPATFARGEGLVGQAALRTELTVIDAPDGAGLALRSGVVAVAPRTLVLLPLVRGAVVTAVLELAAIRPWREDDSALLVAASETVAIALEVARARAAARALLAQTQRQASELERASATLEQRAEELARASAYKSQFLANMSHELRTPLNAIIGFSELMYDGSVPLDAETTHEYLGDILTSGRHLLQLINDVLDLAKVEAGKVEFHPESLQLSRVVGEVLAVLRTTSAKQQVDITTDIAAEVEQLVLDPSRLKQVLYNYLSNAIKFTPARGRVTVRATASGADRVRIEVEDSGVGIPADQIGKLFGDYQQTDDGARKAGGTGLGLALTKRLVEAQGGEVGVRSAPGSGSTFHVVLPRTASDAATAAPTSTLQITAAPAGAPTILVVEDEAGDRDRLVAALVAAGYAVESVATGAEAIARGTSRTYDAITLDLLLPDMSGLEVLAKLREGRNEAVPVIVVTVVAERGAVAGFAVHDVLAKPLVEPALLASLQRAGVATERGVVLVVDDDPASLKVMAATLGHLGYLAVCESDPVRGLRLATEEPPAAIVLDLLMPGMSGFEFLERYRTSSATRKVPIIVWTSKDLTTEELVRLRMAAHAVVSKGDAGNARVLAELAASIPVTGAAKAVRS